MGIPIRVFDVLGLRRLGWLIFWLIGVAAAAQTPISTSGVSGTCAAPTVISQPTAQSGCEGGAVILSATVDNAVGISYAWYHNGLLLPDSVEDGNLLVLNRLTPAKSGNYSAVISNACGSVTTQVVSVTVAPKLTMAISATHVSCYGVNNGVLSMSATGGVAPIQFSLNGLQQQTINRYISLRAGDFQVAATDAFGCSVQQVATITQPSPLKLSLTGVNVKCAGGLDGGIIARASGGTAPYTFQLNTNAAGTDSVFVDLKAAAYTVTLTDKAGCVTSQTLTIGEPAAFDAQITSTPTHCVGSADGRIQVLSVASTGPFLYQVGNGAFQEGTIFTGLAVGTYELTIQNGIGCQLKRTITVSQPNALTMTALATPVNCAGATSGAISVQASGGAQPITYRLTSSSAVQATPVFRNLAAGDYTVVAADTNGCTALLAVTIPTADKPKLRATVTDARCCVCPTGVVALTTDGGAGTTRAYQLLGQTATTPTGVYSALGPGIYRFRVADEVGCADTLTATVADASAMTLTVGSLKNESCVGLRNGEASVAVTGGTKPYVFYWQTPGRDTLRSHSASQTGLAAGTYTVSVVDSNRCRTNTVFADILAVGTPPNQPTVQVSPTGLQVVNAPTAGIQWYIQTADTAAARPVANATQPTLTPQQSGRYTVVLTDKGCASLPSAPVSFVLTATEGPTVSLAVRVWPNPAAGYVQIEVEQPVAQPITLTMRDLSGRRIKSESVAPFSGNKSIVWPLNDVSAGIYLLQTRWHDRQQVIRVVVE